MSEQNLKRMILAIASVINLLVAVNIALHNPFIGYDAKDHLDYLSVAAAHLPTESDSAEYYSPPLPYYLPSLIFQSCTSGELPCKYMAGKFAQGINLILSIVITIFLIKIAELIRPGNQHFKIATLLVFGLFTVYYKTFSQVRGEPYLAFFEVLSIHMALKLGRSPETITLKDGLLLGIYLGGLGLSRQWGFLLLPAIVCIALLISIPNHTFGLKYGTTVLVSFFVAFLICGWFYIHLRDTYGSFTAFNVDPRKFSLSNQPVSFYRNTGLGNLLLFRSPTRNTFDNQFIPLFYSDTWGDYWCYFTCVSNIPDFGYTSNKSTINSYLGKVNFASLFPSFVLAAGMILGLRSLIQSLHPKLLSFQSQALAFLFLIVLISLTGYLWFLIKYPLLPRGSTIKATYMIQIFMVLPFLAANFIEYLRVTKPWIYRVCIIMILVVFVHNLPAMITRYW
jgi:hypothetical protein